MGDKLRTPGQAPGTERDVAPAAPAPGALDSLSGAIGNRAFAAMVSRQPQPQAQPAAASTVEADIEKYKKTAWPPLTGYEPSSQRGRFDVKLDAAAGTLTVTLKVGFNFKDGDPKKYPGFRPAELRWRDAAEKKDMADKYLADMSKGWSGAHKIRNTTPGWDKVSVAVTVSVVRDDASPHFKVDLIKAPPDAMPGAAGVAPPGFHHSDDGKHAVENAAGDRTGHLVMDTNAIDRALPHLDKKLQKKGTRVLFKPGTANFTSSSHFMDAFKDYVAKSDAAQRTAVLTGSTSTHRPKSVSKDDFPVWAMDLSRQRTKLVREGLTGMGIPGEKIVVMNSGANGSGPAATDDYVDVLVAIRPLHNTAMHETGHMLGNTDEYATKTAPAGSAVDAAAGKMYKTSGGGTAITRGPSEGLMSMGGTIGKHNYAAFAEAVSKITKMSAWTSG